MRSPTTRRAALAVTSIALAASAFGGASAAAQSMAPAVAPPAPTGFSGEIRISGSSTVRPISETVRDFFIEGSPDVGVTVDGPGTGDGFVLFCNGDIDIADASRVIKDSEKEACKTAGIDYVELYIALDGLAIITAAANDATPCLSFNDLYALLGPESGPIDPFTGTDKHQDDTKVVKFDNWSQAQALATELGSSTTFPDAPLTITGPGEESGTYDFLRTTVIVPIATARNLPEPADAQVRPDYQSSGDDNAIVEGVAGTAENATTLGWVGYAYVEENLDRIKPLAVDGGKGCIENTFATIADGTYPISRPLFLYVNKAKAAANPAVSAFVDYYLTPGTIEAVLQTPAARYVPLAKETIQATRDAWSAR